MKYNTKITSETTKRSRKVQNIKRESWNYTESQLKQKQNKVF